MKEAIYLIVAKSIEEKINNGLYKIKEKLPSERDLAHMYSVSRMTARQALIYLQEKGMVYRELGSGTFVQAPTIEQENVKSFTETVSAMGYKADSRILEFSVVHKLKNIARQLDLTEDEDFYKLKRLRLGNNIPMALEVLYIPVRYVPNLSGYNLEGSFYGILKEVYETNIVKVSYQVEAIIANPIFLKLMELNKTTALLKVAGVSYDDHDRKFMYEESLYRSDLYNYHIDINKKY